MLKQVIYAGVTAALLSLGSGAAMADESSPYPKDNSLDYSIVVGMPAESPFPEDNSIDHTTVVAGGSGAESPYPSDNSLDHGIQVSRSDADSPFPTDYSALATVQTA